jgi:hypothetical protein
MRIVGIIGLMLSALFAPFWFFILYGVAYAFVVKNAYELVLVAVCVDAVFGESTQGFWCMYTCAASVIIIVTAFARPYFTFNT